MTPFQVMLCTVRSEGNCGNGEAGAIAEPREAQLHTDRASEVAWHHGKTASATGHDAMKRHGEREAS